MIAVVSGSVMSGVRSTRLLAGPAKLVEKVPESEGSRVVDGDGVSSSAIVMVLSEADGGVSSVVGAGTRSSVAVTKPSKGKKVDDRG